jgi:microcystin degradation protein MlrC
MMAAENRPRVLSISFAHGFQFGDVAHAGAKILAVTDDDTSLANELAREFGMRVYGLRQRIGFDSIALPMEDALSRAMASHHTPIVIADQSDNIGAGAPGDATFALQWLLERNAEDVGLAIFYDPDVVRDAKAAGVGATLSINLGGKMGPFSGDPVRLDVSVGSIVENYVHALPQQSGESPQFFAGDVVAVRTGSIDIVIASERCQCFGPSIFKDLGIDPTKKRLLIAKSAQHFYAGFAPIAGEIIYMAAQGAVVPDPRRIRYRRLDTSAMYPWVSEPLLG